MSHPNQNQCNVQEATEVLWEADDDHTGALDVQDLVELYFRVTTDATGYEPRRLFCMLEFLLFSAPSVCLLDAQRTRSFCTVVVGSFVLRWIAVVDCYYLTLNTPMG